MTTLDPFTYEVLRHRLTSIAAEGAIALQRVSGSSLATEALDLNTSIMTAAGDVVFIGPYVLTGPTSQGLIVRRILADYLDNPGVEPGDMFVCNDPYAGAAHQNCVTVVAPIHVDGRLIAWCGATLHVVDVGGPQAGQVGIGARSIFEEAPPIPPLRIVAGGRMLRDVEAEYLRRSRTPELNGLDLRAKIAALNTISERVRGLAEDHGAELLGQVMDLAIERGVRHIRRRISELPEGAASHSAYVEQVEDGRTVFYEIRLRAEKHGDQLVFDFRGSSPQAGAVVNCTRGGLLSGVLVGVMTVLVWDAPWCPAAIERSIEILSDPGTVVDASWPAGCSMATMAAGFAATSATALTLGELLASNERHRGHAMASWAGAVGSVDMFGTDSAGRPFGTVILDSMASGTGARATADGIDSGGFLRSISCVVANVEAYEARYPFLYLWRRHEPDTGGPGRRRGGVGVSFAIVPHGVDRIPTVIPHFAGTVEPESAGLFGGYPGATNSATVLPGSNVADRLHAGQIPDGLDALAGRARSLPGVDVVALESDDVFVVVTTGGGGWGDPIEREPLRVAADVRAGLVSRTEANLRYGVLLDADGAPDGRATAARRSGIRRRRALAAARPVSSRRSRGNARLTVRPAEGAGERPDGVEIAPDRAAWTARCRRCGFSRRASSADDARAGFPSVHRRLEAAGSMVAPDRADHRFVLHEQYCPACLRLVSTVRTMVEAEEDAYA